MWRPRQYSRGCEKSTIVLRLLLHMIFGLACIFGLPATLNDINVVDHSPIFEGILQGQTSGVNYFVNGHHYQMGYYFTDEILSRMGHYPSIRLSHYLKTPLFS